MALDSNDLSKIEAPLVKHLTPIKEDLSVIKADVKLLASLIN